MSVLQNFTAEELEAALEQKRLEQKNAKKEYEAQRDTTVSNLVRDAIALNQLMQEMKDRMNSKLDLFRRDVLEPYTGVQSSANLTITNTANTLKVQYQTLKQNVLDERADQAAEHLRSFLSNMVNEQNKVAFDLINSLLEKKGGEYDARLITRLFPYENEYSDWDWKEAIRLFKESITKGDSSQYIRMYYRNSPLDKWQSVVLDFAALPMNIIEVLD